MGGGHMLPYSWRQWAFGSNCKGPYRAFPLGTPVFEWQLCERVISLNLRKLPVTSPWVWLAPLVNRFHTTTELATSYVYIKGTFFWTLLFDQSVSSSGEIHSPIFPAEQQDRNMGNVFHWWPLSKVENPLTCGRFPLNVLQYRKWRDLPSRTQTAENNLTEGF